MGDILSLSSYEITLWGLPNLVVSTAIGLIGLSVAVREGFTPLTRRFLLLNWAAALWLFCFSWMYWAVQEPVALFWARLAYLGIPFIPAALYHFTLTLFGKTEHRGPFIFAAWSLATIFSVLFITTEWLLPGLYLYRWGYYTRYDETSMVFLVYFLFVLAASVRQYIDGIRRQDEPERSRGRLLFFAMGVGHIGLVDFLPSLGIEVFPFGFVGMAAYLGIVWYSIQHYRLAELPPAFAADEALDSMQGAVLVLDLDGRVRLSNRASCRMLGRGARELTGLPVALATGADWGERTALDSWVFRDRSMTWKGRDGVVLAVNVSSAVVRDWDRRPAGIILTAVDVTQREDASRRLRESERRFRQLVESVPDLILIHRGGKIVYLNPAGMEMLGVSRPTDVLGRDLLDFVHPSSHLHVTEGLRRAAAGEVVENEEERLARLDGSPVDVEVTALSHLEEEGEGTILIARDISEMKRSHEELQHSLSLVKSTLESTADGILVVDRLGRIVSYNRRFAEMWRVPASLLEEGDDDAVIATVLDQLADPEGFLTKVRDLYRHPGADSHDAIEFRDGRVFERYSTPQWIDGLPVGRVWSFRNVTGQKRSEEALRRRDRILESVAFASEGFLRTPDWRASIDDVLAWLGAGTGVDAIRILESSDEDGETVFSVKHGWSRELARASESSLRSVRVSAIESAADRLAAGEVVDLKALPAAEQQALAGGVGHGMLVPIMPDGRLWGVMALFAKRRTREWSGSEVEALRAAAATLAAAILRERGALALLNSERRYRLLFERNLAGVYRNTLDGRVLDCNEACARIFGYSSREELIGQRATAVYFDAAEREQFLRDLQARRTLLNREVCFRRRDGSPVWVIENVSLLEDEGGAPTLVEGTIIDITDRKEAEKQVQYQAYHDALTSLPNRMLFLDRLSMAIAHAHRFGRHVGVMFLDLDHFKFINDTLGHTIGDLLLRAVAGRLQSALRDEDTVARIGGDEFTVLVSDLKTAAGASRVAEKILEAVAEPILIEGHELFVTTSIGIALYPEDGSDPEALLKNADSAMYRAKEQGRNNYQLCTPALNARALARLTMEQQLRRAIDRGEFAVWLQPQVRIETGEIAGVETLLRWMHPERGLVLPGDFIGLAEESRLIFPIGELVLREACRLGSLIRSAAGSRIRVSVNLSARQFQQRDLVQQLTRSLDLAGLEPTLLEIEITEGVAMANSDYTLALLHDLRDLGIGIAIDDFGTGHSSLSYLRRFPVDALKIDRSFISELDRHSSDRAIVTAIITMARGLGLRVVAEGVETEAQRAFLADHRCDEIQGFLFSPAVPIDQLLRMIAAGRSPGEGAPLGGEIPS